MPPSALSLCLWCHSPEAHPSGRTIELSASSAGNYFLGGDWHDVLMSANNAVSVRLQTDKFTGKQVFHCHILEHEDQGMCVCACLMPPLRYPSSSVRLQ